MLKITEQLRDEILRYLCQKPYMEVVNKVMALSALQKVEEVKEDKKENKK